MDRRPPNPRRLSRKLFSGKPSITPEDRTIISQRKRGPTEKLTPIRSDIGGIEVRKDYKTYEKKGYWDSNQQKVKSGREYDEEARKEIAKLFDKDRQNMTRAQLRKLGRVIRNGETGPIRRGLAKQEKLDEAVRDTTTYELGEERHIAPVEGFLEYYRLKEGEEETMYPELKNKIDSANAADKYFTNLNIAAGKKSEIAAEYINPDVSKYSKKYKRRIPKSLRKYIDADNDKRDAIVGEVVKELPFLTPEDRKRMIREIEDDKFVKGIKEDPYGAEITKRFNDKGLLWGQKLVSLRDGRSDGKSLAYVRETAGADESPLTTINKAIVNSDKIKSKYVKEKIPFLGKSDLESKLTSMNTEKVLLHPEFFDKTPMGKSVRESKTRELTELNRYREEDNRRGFDVPYNRSGRYDDNLSGGRRFGFDHGPRLKEKSAYKLFRRGIINPKNKEDEEMLGMMVEPNNRYFTSQQGNTDGIDKAAEYLKEYIGEKFYKDEGRRYADKYFEPFTRKGKDPNTYLGDDKPINFTVIKRVGTTRKQLGKYVEEKDDWRNFKRVRKVGNKLVKKSNIKRTQQNYNTMPQTRTVRTRYASSAMRNPDFTMRVARGKGRRIFHLDEAKDKGWKKVEGNEYLKQSSNWKALDVDTTPKDQLQLRGLRDMRTSRGRLIGRGRLNPRRVDRSTEYKSARQEAIIQMRINETAGVRDAKSKADKEIKNIRISEAQKALNLKLQKETAEKTTEALKQKNKGLTHSYNVNVRNQTAATLLGSDPDELNKILKKGGGLGLIKTMIRKGEISDVSTIGQLSVSSKQKENLLRLFNEGGDFVEGQEYFYRTLDDFGRTIVQRGYLNKGGERKDNLELMKITTNDDGTNTTERFIVPKGQILAPDDYTTTTTSGKKQGVVPDAITDFELDLFSETAPSPKKAAVKQDPKTGVKSLVKSKGSGIADPSPREGGSVLSLLKTSTDFDTMGGDLSLGGLDELPFSDDSGSGSSVDFDFGGDAPTEPEPAIDLEDVEDKPPTPYGIKPSTAAEIDEALELAEAFGGGEGEEISSLVEGGERYKLLGSPRLGEAVDKLRSALKKKPVEEEEEAKEEEEVPKKRVTIADEIAATFSPQQTTLGEKKPNVVPKGWRATTEVPTEILKQNWDFRQRGLKSRLEEGGTQEVPEGYTAIWTTKYGDRDNQTALLVNESDIYYLVRGIRGVSIENDSGNKRPISEATLKSFYRKTLENIRSGKKETPFNNKQLLRAFDMIPLYGEESEEEESD